MRTTPCESLDNSSGNRNLPQYSSPQYSSLSEAIDCLCKQWCDSSGYSDPFLKDGEWWAFPPKGVIPVKVKAVMGETSQREVKVDSLRMMLFPDGSLASPSIT